MFKIKPTFIPAITWLLVSTFLLTMPGEEIPKENFFTRIQLDKWVHIIMFFIMVTLWCWAVPEKKNIIHNRRKTFALIAIVSFLYGVGMEFVQRYLTANRSFDAGDIVADGVGCIIGYFYCTGRYIKK
ncbi:MAG: VanZ family protein [Chitinophagaceae bacterium]|nr:VanZ family protein [Chitinophagaceae bacterium]